VELVWFNCVPR